MVFKMRVTFNKVAYSVLFSYFIIACLSGYIWIKNTGWKDNIRDEKFNQLAGVHDMASIQEQKYEEVLMDGKKKFKCGICKRLLSRRDYILQHLSRDHLVSVENVSTGQKQQSFVELNNDGRKMFKCHLCKRQFCQKRNVLLHLNRDHEMSPVKKKNKLHKGEESIQMPILSCTAIVTALKNKVSQSNEISNEMHTGPAEDLSYAFGGHAYQTSQTAGCVERPMNLDCSVSESESENHSIGSDSDLSSLNDSLSDISDISLDDSEIEVGSDFSDQGNLTWSDTSYSESCNSDDGHNHFKKTLTESEEQGLTIFSCFQRNNLSASSCRDILKTMRSVFPNSRQLLNFDYIQSFVDKKPLIEVHYCEICKYVFPTDQNVVSCISPDCVGLRYKGPMANQHRQERQPRKSFIIADIKNQLTNLLQTPELAEDDLDWNPWGEEFENERIVISHHEPPKILWNLEPHKTDGKEVSNKVNSTFGIFNVEVWGKAAIGHYLWEHILQGPLEEKMGGVWSYGAKTINNIKFTFRTGPGVVPDQVPKNTENLLLILNGREPVKVEFAKTWLNSLSTMSQLKNVALILLGNEQCDNSWLFPYMHNKGGPIRFVFFTYDTPDIDDVNFYQWPLGVATYRRFPIVDSSQLPVYLRRKFTCNFMGTVYRNSSREQLLQVLDKTPVKNECFIKPRMSWLPDETPESIEEYIQTLSQSDLTLNPVGKNTECYRIYEAISYGSIPVIEDVMTPGNCGKSQSSSLFPLRLLKEMEAPILFIKNWSELTDILLKEKTLRHSDKVKRRRNLLLWYESFKSKMREKLVRAINKHFWGLNR